MAVSGFKGIERYGQLAHEKGNISDRTLKNELTTSNKRNLRSKNRTGSSVETIGAPRPKLVELRVLPKMHTIQWKRPQVDLSELARLRWIKKWPRLKLAQHFRLSENTVQAYFQEFKRGRIHKLKLDPNEKQRILEIWKR